MRAIYSFIVEPLNNRRYDNVKSYDQVDFITSVSEEDYKAANRYAKVKSLPLQYSGDFSNIPITSDTIIDSEFTKLISLSSISFLIFFTI